METQELTSITENLRGINLHDRTSEGIKHRAHPLIVDTSEAVKSLVETLALAQADSNSIYLDLEGVNLSRHGSISLIQIWIPLHDQPFIVDVHTLGTQAFSTPNTSGETLKTVLE